MLLSGIFDPAIFDGAIFDEGAAVTALRGGGFTHIGRFTREELEPEEAVTVATTEALPVKPLSRKMRKRLAVVAKQKPIPVDDDEEEEAFMLLLAA